MVTQSLKPVSPLDPHHRQMEAIQECHEEIETFENELPLLKYAHQRATVTAKHDSVSTFDEEEEANNRKKIDPRLYAPQSLPFQPIPQLIRPDDLVIKTVDKSMPALVRASEALVQMPKVLGSDDDLPKKLEDTTESPLKTVKPSDSDFAIDKDVLDRLQALRVSHQDAAVTTFKEVMSKQMIRKTMHNELNEMMKKLEERGILSKILGWLQHGSSAALIIFSVACFAAAIFTGGVSAVLGALSAVAGTASGVIGGTNSLVQMDTQQKQGQATELRELRSLEETRVHALLGDNKQVWDKLHILWDMSIKILQNRKVNFFT